MCIWRILYFCKYKFQVLYTQKTSSEDEIDLRYKMQWYLLKQQIKACITHDLCILDQLQY